MNLRSDYRRRRNEILRFDPDMVIGHVDQGGDLTTVSKPTSREVFEDWLYGEYLHDDEDRIERIDLLRGIAVHEFLFIKAPKRTHRPLLRVRGARLSHAL